jgi:NOL1/NOP2/fmu family ribosome biogenesis protein
MKIKMKVDLLDNTKKKKMLNMLEREYGIINLSYLVLETGKGKYRIYSGGLSREELNMLAKTINIEIIGAKICKIEEDKIRLDFDIINLPEIKKQINKNTFEISDKNVKQWMQGDNLNVKTESNASYFIIKNKNDLLGTGQNAKVLIKNYIPKERRVKS